MSDLLKTRPRRKNSAAVSAESLVKGSLASQYFVDIVSKKEERLSLIHTISFSESSIMEDSSCTAVREFNVAAKELWRQFSLLLVLFALFVINVILNSFQKKVIPRLAVYKHLQAEVCEEMGMRMMQLVFGPIIFLSGIGFLLYQAITGCNSNEIYTFYIAGFSLVTIDVHEFVRRWPLRAPLLAHHLMTFAIAIAFVEFDALPPNENKTIDWTTVLFLSLIGLMWTIDFYHVVYRTSENLDLIKKLRKVYLFLAPVRCTNILLLGLGSIQSALFGVWFGFSCLLFMTLAYAYNSYKAITFVMAFDCERYYNSHQKKWFAEPTVPVAKPGSRPSLAHQGSSSIHSSISKISSGIGRSASARFNIKLAAEDEVQELLPGLRGDRILDDLLNDDESPDDHADPQNPKKLSMIGEEKLEE